MKETYQPKMWFVQVVDILKEYKVEFSYMDILEDPIEQHPSVSDWPRHNYLLKES